MSQILPPDQYDKYVATYGQGAADSMGLSRGQATAAPAPVTPQAQDLPSYQQKNIIELDPRYNRLAVYGDRSLRDAQKASSKGGVFDRDATNYANDILNAHPDLATMSVSDFLQKVKDPNFVQQYGVGKVSSYQDLAKEALAKTAGFDSADTQSVDKLAQDLQARGLGAADRETISGLAYQQQSKAALDKAQNPQNYLSDTQKSNNLDQANQLVSQVFGADHQDPQLAQFLSDHLAKGETPYELAQFLKTTPDYVAKQNDIQAQKQNADALAARTALDQNLQQTQQQVFEKATPNIIASYMKAGRLNSSGLNAALAQAQQQLDQQRQSFLGQQAYNQAVTQQGYNQQGYVQNQGQAFQDYLRQSDPANQQRYNLQNQGNYLNYQFPMDQLSRQYSLSDQARQQAYDLQNYNMQKNDYQQYLNSGSPNRGQQALRGAATGASAGSAFGPWGAAIGGIAGGIYGYSQ